MASKVILTVVIRVNETQDAAGSRKNSFTKYTHNKDIKESDTINKGLCWRIKSATIISWNRIAATKDCSRLQFTHTFRQHSDIVGWATFVFGEVGVAFSEIREGDDACWGEVMTMTPVGDVDETLYMRCCVGYCVGAVKRFVSFLSVFSLIKWATLFCLING